LSLTLAGNQRFTALRKRRDDPSRLYTDYHDRNLTFPMRASRLCTSPELIPREGATGVGSPPDPEGLMRQFLSSEIAAKGNKWQRTNATRWKSEAYDNLFHAAEGELDPVKRAVLFIAMNDMVVEAGVVIPVVCRPQVSAISKKLRATLSGWDGTFWNLKDWYRQA
jgi:ABC-type transport system substrate-binding protein